MTDRLDAFARRMTDDRRFLASALQAYARSEGLDGDALAAFLGCDRSRLGPLGLCRRPARERFASDLTAIAERFGIARERLGEVVRRAEVLEALQARKSEAEIMAAARDREREDGR